MKRDMVLKRKQIYLTKDLIRRTDFIITKRYKHYNPNGKDPNKEELSNENKCEVFLKIFNCSKKTYCIPIVDRDSTESSTDIKELSNLIANSIGIKELEVADTEIEDNKVQLSLIGLEEMPTLLNSIFRKKIPFILVSPNNMKCEWLNIKGTKTVTCYECEEKKTCTMHNKVYGKNSSVDKIVDRVKKTIFDSKIDSVSIKNYKETFEKCVTKIPIFSYSSSIDIARWHNFDKDLEEFVKTVKRIEERKAGTLDNMAIGTKQLRE